MSDKKSTRYKERVKIITKICEADMCVLAELEERAADISDLRSLISDQKELIKAMAGALREAVVMLDNYE